MTETLEKIASAIIQEPVKISVDIRPKNKLHQVLQKLKIAPDVRVFELRPIVTGSLVKISKLLLPLNVDIKTFDSVNQMFENGYKSMEQHGENMAKIIALAIVNRKKDPPQSLIDLILYNFTSKDLLATLGLVVSQMDVTSFTSSIISVRAMNLLKMSPQEQGSQIASGPLSVEQ